MDNYKSSYNGYTDARKKANATYLKEKVEDIRIRVPKGKKDYYKETAASMGLSLNQFVISAMDSFIKHHNS